MTFGEKLRQLMSEREISLRKPARQVPCDPGHLSRVVNGRKPPSSEIAQRLDDLLEAGGALATLRKTTHPGSARGAAANDAVALATWLEQSNIGDGAIGYLETATRRLTYDYPRRPPLAVLDDARQLQAHVTHILRSGRQHLAQT